MSPAISEDLDVPYEQYNEWYFSRFELTFPAECEQFVNYGSFNLAKPEELTRDDDPSWE